LVITRLVTLPTIIAATLLTTGVPQAGAARSTQGRVAEMTEALTAILNEDWHPRPTDPRWLAIKREVEAEITRRPREPIATLARRAAVRIEVQAARVRPSGSSLEIDLRPWFNLSTVMPYNVDFLASLNGGPWVHIGSASSGAHCGSGPLELEEQSTESVGFHRIDLIADVTFLRSPPKGPPPCAFSKASSETADPMAQRAAKNILFRERRFLPAVSFGRFTDDADPFRRAARQVLASDLDPSLPPIRLERWLASIVDSGTAAQPGPRVSWITEYCNSEEAMWYPGDSVNESYWLAGSKARQRERALCAVALSELSGSRILYVLIQVGVVTESSGGWMAVTPTFHSAHMMGNTNILEISALSSIPNDIRLDEEMWPKVDLVVLPGDLSVMPVQPKPGDEVAISIGFKNVGAADANYAHGTLAWCIGVGCNGPYTALRDVHGRIPAGETFFVRHSFTLPDGSADVAMCMQIVPPNGVANGLKATLVLDLTPEDNCVGLEIRPQGVRRIH
jgi:hypothetical protein